MAEVRTPAPEVLPERRGALLELQVERAALALDQLRQTQDRLHEAEARLSALTDACAGVLDRWTDNEEQHASAVSELRGRLAQWNEIERRLLGQSTARIHHFEQRLQQEWHALRDRQEQPARQLQEQVVRVTDACVAGVAAAVRSCDQAEMRFAAAQQRLADDMVALTREVREVLAELRHGRSQLAPLAPWPLEDVRRLHGALRADAHVPDDHDDVVGEAAGSPLLAREAREVHLPEFPQAEADDRAAPLPGSEPRPKAPGQRPSTTGDDGPDVTVGPTLAWPPSRTTETVMLPGAAERALAAAATTDRAAATRSRIARAGLLVAVATIGAVGYLSFQARNEARTAAARAVGAERELAAVREQARAQLSAVEQSADNRFETMQRTARSAQVLAGILLATDVRRFELAPASPRATESSALVLLSRRQGVVFNATRLSEPPDGWEYQLWLLAPGRALSAGTLRPEAGGRVSTAFDVPADLPRPIVGALLTLEPAGGSTQPSGEVVFKQPVPPPAAAVPQS
jgi:hypothetical protein